MQLNFTYDTSKDIWCLLNKGSSSNNSNKPTAVYSQLIGVYGEDPTEKEAGAFIGKYLKENPIDVGLRMGEYRADWEKVGEEFQDVAGELFGVALPENVTAYLTVNNRCPYNIEENYFFVSVSSNAVRETIMHELWHFYTWHRFGQWQEKIGKHKYNELKEALTVLINVECKDLLPFGSEDKGYSQHKELRKEILGFWGKEGRDAGKLWDHFASI